MKISQGYVAVTEDGEFLSVGQSHTHTGHHVDVTVVKTVEDATVHPYPQVGRVVSKHMPKDYKMIPVEVRREVNITGYGVQP